jgi:hypothetical protein
VRRFALKSARVVMQSEWVTLAREERPGKRSESEAGVINPNVVLS